jgi:hypothetical protein
MRMVVVNQLNKERKIFPRLLQKGIGREPAAPSFNQIVYDLVVYLFVIKLLLCRTYFIPISRLKAPQDMTARDVFVGIWAKVNNFVTDL